MFKQNIKDTIQAIKEEPGLFLLTSLITSIVVAAFIIAAVSLVKAGLILYLIFGSILTLLLGFIVTYYIVTKTN